MSKTLLSILILAGVVIVFVVARFTGVDVDLPLNTNTDEQPSQEMPRSVYDTWVEFSQDSQRFQVKFPRQPAHLSEETHDAFGVTPKKYEIYMADGFDNKAYMLEVITYPEGPSLRGNEKILENTLNDILSHSTQNNLEESKEGRMAGEKALHFEIDSGDKKLRGVIFESNNILYVLTRVSPEGFSDEMEDYTFFIDSFTLKKDSHNTKDVP